MIVAVFVSVLGIVVSLVSSIEVDVLGSVVVAVVLDPVVRCAVLPFVFRVPEVASVVTVAVHCPSFERIL